MTAIGANIKRIRKEKKISMDKLATELGLSVSTLYRYEDSSIQKIPVKVFDKMCEVLGVSAAELMGNESSTHVSEKQQPLPTGFDNPQEAMEFMLKLPTLAAYGGYDLENMSDETILEFAEEILQMLKLVSYKYKK